MSRLLPLALALCGTATCSSAADSSTAPVRRLALVAGANSGAPTRARLRFATTDADRFATTLRQMGGVAEPDCVVLREPTRRALLDALAVLRDDVRRAQAFARRTEVLFYFSGHADEEGLQLGRERISYPELREALAGVPSDVRIAILDACSSGAITRLKGGRMQPAFLSDVSSEVRGQAFLTSSSAAEAAQESDHLQGSFFTNALVSGLRGAADASGDGKVTLNEAYEFAFDETLARTAATQGGSQHPTYDIRMAGSGDVVLTDLRETRAAIVIGPELDGRFFVRDASGRLVAELGKPKGRTTELGVEPGAYEVEYEQGSAQLRARVQVAEGEHRALGRPEMQAVQRKPTRLRGGPAIDPWSAGGRSRVELHLGGSQLSASSSAAATGTSGQVSGAAFDLGYAYGLRKDLWLDLRLVALNLDVADRVDSLSGPETRTRGTYGALLGVRAFAPIAGSVRPFGVLGVGVATDFVSVDSPTSSDFKSSNAGIVVQAGGGVEVRIGSHTSLDLALLYTGHEGSSGAGISLGFGWTMGHPR